jgi:hypothetical protein
MLWIFYVNIVKFSIRTHRQTEHSRQGRQGTYVKNVILSDKLTHKQDNRL